MKFRIEIATEADLMQAPMDVVSALSRVKTDIIRQCHDPICCWPNGFNGALQPVTDDEGNTVGNWTLCV